MIKITDSKIPRRWRVVHLAKRVPDWCCFQPDVYTYVKDNRTWHVIQRRNGSFFHFAILRYNKMLWKISDLPFDT